MTWFPVASGAPLPVVSSLDLLAVTENGASNSSVGFAEGAPETVMAVSGLLLAAGTATEPAPLTRNTAAANTPTERGRRRVRTTISLSGGLARYR